MKKPYKISPYKDMASQGCPWIDDVKTRVLSRIGELNDFIVDQADKDGIPDFVNDDFLYECFHENLKFNLALDNLQVLKYFTWKFKIKILRDIIGDWCFTKRDVELYNYFRTADYSSEPVGKFFYVFDKDCKSPSLFVNDKKCKWFMQVDGEDEFYTNFFYKEIILLNDMLRNVRGSNLLIPNELFFDGAVLHAGLNLTNKIDYSDYTDRKFK